MRLTIVPTLIITTIDGVPVRLWRGETEDGRPVEVFVHRVRSDDPDAQAQLGAVLAEVPEPRELHEIRSRRLAEVRPETAGGGS